MSPHPRSLLAAGLLLAAGSAFAEPGASNPFAPATNDEPIRLAQAPGVMGHFLDGAEDDSDQGGGDTGGGDDGNTGGDGGSGGEVIGGGDGSGLTDWEDPTQLDHYVDYPEEQPISDEMTQSLGEIANNMRPGEWRKLPGAKYLAHGKWTDKAMWDASRQRVSYVAHHTPGGERPTRWVMWDVADGYWLRQTGDEFHPKAGINNQWGYRSYGKYTQLSDGSNVYSRFDRLWKQNPETLEWSAWTMNPCYEIISNIEYYPEMRSVISFGATFPGSDKTKLCAYDIDTGGWTRLSRPMVQGRHSLMRYNPVRGEMLLLGGDQSYRAAQILKPDGSLVRAADAPRNMRIMKDMLAVDPVSGHYLALVYTEDDKRGVTSRTAEFFGFDADADRWYQIDIWTRAASHVEGLNPPAWPFSSKHAEPVVVALPEYGVTLWLESTRRGVQLYKHDVAAD